MSRLSGLGKMYLLTIGIDDNNWQMSYQTITKWLFTKLILPFGTQMLLISAVKSFFILNIFKEYCNEKYT